ncbi:MAG: hypothetical protein ACRD10_06960 [Terriglobia bacterium]
MKSTALRAQVEAALGPGYPSPFTYHRTYTPELLPWGFKEIDALTGGLPRGGLVEILGSASSGRTSLLNSIFARATGREEFCALIDVHDAFDPYSAKVTGVDLERLLWVRCRIFEQALKAADLILQSGGFGVVALDMSGVVPQFTRRVPLSFWFRLRRAIEYTPAVFIMLGQESTPCASLTLRSEAYCVQWSFTAAKTGTSKAKNEDLVQRPARHAWLLSGICFHAGAVRSRTQNTEGRDSASFELITPWKRFNSAVTGDPITPMGKGRATGR